MPAAFRDLVTPETPESINARLLAILTASGFPVASWPAKSIVRKLLGGFSDVLAGWSNTIADATTGGFRSLAKDGWLDLLGEDLYRCPRFEAVTCVRPIVLTNSATSASTTITKGTLCAKSDSGLLFRNVGPDVPTAIEPGGSLTVQFEAEKPGAAYNVEGSTIRALVTPLAGVSIVGVSGIENFQVEGTDREPLERYRERLGDRWAMLDGNDSPPAAAYRGRARSLSAQIRRVQVLECTPGPGFVTMYLYGQSGPVPTALVSRVAAEFERRFWRPRCVGLYVYSAQSRTIWLAGAVQCARGTSSAARAVVDKRLADLTTATESGGTIDFYELVSIVRTAPGVVHAELTSPIADTALLPHECARFLTDALVYVEPTA